MTDIYVPPFKEFAIGVVFRAGQILMRNFNDELKKEAHVKDKKEIVTKSDLEVDEYITYKVRQQFPEHNLLSEESGFVDNGSEYTWVLDPLDGTLNYSIGNPFFSTTMALLKNDEPLIALTYAPYTKEMFIAEKQKSCRLNERDLIVSNENDIQKSVISFSYFHRDAESRARSIEVWQRFDDVSRSMRHLGSTSLELAYVASGRMEASIIAPPLRQWDIAAGRLLVECAGGRITNFEGQPWTSLEEGIVISNGHVHDQILEVLSQAGV